MRLDGAKTRRYASVVLFLLIVPPFIKYTAFETWNYVGGDFEIFYRASSDIRDGRNPYPREVLENAPSEAVGKAWGNYIYPPLFARILEPLLFLPPEWAKKGYLAICLLLYLILLRPTAARGYAGWAAGALAWTLILGWGPTIHTFRHGQSDFVPLFLILGALAYLRSPGGGFREQPAIGRERWAGFLLGAASMVKITPILFAPLLFVTTRWRILRMFVVGAVAALVSAGPVLSWQYFTQVLPAMRDFSGMRHCPSLHIVLVRLFDQILPGEHDPEHYRKLAEVFGVGLTAVLFAGVLYYFWRNRSLYTRGELIVAGCYLPPLFAGEVEHHYLPALIPVLESTRRLLHASAIPEPLGSGFPAHDPYTTQNVPRQIIRARKRLLAILAAISPNFYYWAVPKLLFETLSPFTFQTLMVLGNSAAFLLIVPILQSNWAYMPKSGSRIEEDGREQDADLAKVGDGFDVAVPPEVGTQSNPERT